MLKAILLSLMTIALVGMTAAQNLVVNPSFEDYLACPNDMSQIDLVPGWTNLFISPDYFNACADDTVSVPYNAVGDQLPSDGDAYAGIGFYDVGGKEYLQGELTEALEPGVLTYVSMRVAPGGFGYPDWTSPTLAASHIGLRFSVEPLDFLVAYGALHFNEAVLFMPTILADTAGWTVLSTEYLPDSAYRYVQIGSFFADSLVSWSVLDAGGDFDWAYALIDMVCVAKQSGVCDPFATVTERFPPVVSQAIIFENHLQLPLAAWGIEGAAEEALLNDVDGRVADQLNLAGRAGIVSWLVEELAAGPYFLRIALRDRPSFVVRSWKL